jgi:MOSC domain-containing protein YiiM
LLGVESLKKAEEQNNRPFAFGDFGENITTEGLELYNAISSTGFSRGMYFWRLHKLEKNAIKDAR